MKLITAIVQNEDANKLNDELIKNDIRATRLETLGSFLSSKNITFLIAIDDERVEETVELIQQNSKKRKQVKALPYALDYFGDDTSPYEIEVGGATVIIQSIDDFRHF